MPKIFKMDEIGIALFIFIIVAIIFIVSVGFIIYEIQHAPLVDPKMPFLHGDYEQKDSETKNTKLEENNGQG